MLIGLLCSFSAITCNLKVWAAFKLSRNKKSKQLLYKQLFSIPINMDALYTQQKHHQCSLSLSLFFFFFGSLHIDLLISSPLAFFVYVFLYPISSLKILWIKASPELDRMNTPDIPAAILQPFPCNKVCLC